MIRVSDLKGESMWWTDAQLATVDDALEAAVAGRPTVLSIEGTPGQGKTALLRELVSRARARQPAVAVLEATAEEREIDEPLGLLRQLGVEPDSLGTTTTGFQGAQFLRHLLDAHADTPLVMTVDDLHWLDHQSLEALASVIDGARGDRLLVAAATRPLRATDHAQWRRVLLSSQVVRVRLDGLDLPDAMSLTHERCPGLSARTARRLHEHTGGNPLYLQAILSEHLPDDLELLDPLPAPDDLAVRLSARLQQLSPDAAALACAVAVIGPNWLPLPLATAVAEVEEPGAAVTVLLDAGLLVLRRLGPEQQIRLAHSVIHSSVYDTIPPLARTALHRRASTQVPSQRDRLRHLVAATDTYDGDLAAHLESYARKAHQDGRVVESSRLLSWAAQKAPEPRERERLWLDALFARLMGRDLEAVERELPEVAWAADTARKALVHGTFLLYAGRLSEALAVLESVDAQDEANLDVLSRYRLRAIRSMVRLRNGLPASEVIASVRAAQALDVHDTTVTTYTNVALLVSSHTLTTLTRDWGDPFPDVPDAPVAVGDEFAAITWRGIYHSTSGRFDVAVRDLGQMIARVGTGATDINGGFLHAHAGLAQWMRGDWAAAHVTLGVAVDLPYVQRDLQLKAVAPLRHIGSGAYDRARDEVAEARHEVMRAPFRVVIQLLGTTETILARLDGTPSGRAGLVEEWRRDLGEHALSLTELLLPIWALHLALAHAWAGETKEALALADQLSRPHTGLAWLSGASAWVRGLVAEADGDLRQARVLLDEAKGHGMPQFPLHQAFVVDDLARVLGTLGDHDAAEAARREATAGLRRLGVPSEPGGAATDLDGSVGSNTAPTPLRLTYQSNDLFPTLTDRERDVVTLLVQGLSYAQIARDLFVTRSTVGYHVTNAYAKLGVASRHEVIDLLRGSS